MSQDRLIGLTCQDCKRLNYHTHKSRLVKEKLASNKFCKHCRKHTAHKESKIKSKKK
ncbi:MAG: 50S ribosomal protein L33 [bacterium]|nr:50S ribosomal protein L33 [bacterium]